MHQVSTDLIAGSIGGACAILAGQPFDVIKSRMQALTDVGANGTFQCIKKSVRSEGIRTLYKGTTPALAGSMTENVVVWSVNEFLRLKLSTRQVRNYVQYVFDALT
jgi:hypothetical protein